MVTLNLRKGISPLIAAVLLIAFTMAVAGIFSQWAPNLIQSIQSETSQDAVDITRASKLGLEIMSVEFNRSSDELEVVVQNTGEAINNKTNVSIGVIGGSVAKTQQYDVDLGSREITTLKLPVNRTYPLETVKADLTDYPVSDESGIKCTPTDDLVGYWTFNKEQTKDGWAIDLSGYGNNGSLKNGVTAGVEGKVGEAYGFDGEDDYIDLGHFMDGARNFTWVSWAKTSISVDPTSRFEMPVILGTVQGGGDTEDALLGVDNGNLGWYNEIGDEYLISDKKINDNKYRHVLVRREAESSTDLFIDGNREVSGRAGSEGINDNGLEIARANWDENNFFNGFVDQVRIYNRSLSQSEIQRLYQVRSEDWAVSGCKLTG